MTAGRLVLIGVLAAPIVFGGATVLAAATAPPDALEPPDAAGLGEAIRSGFWSAIDLPLPPIRTAIRSYERYPKGSFIAQVEVFDIVFGPTPRKALVIAVCWSINHAFSGGWLDAAGAEAELRREIAEGLEAGCGAPNQSRGN
jgi:hypothetical protein